MKIPAPLLVLLTLGVPASQTLGGCADADASAQNGEHKSDLSQPAAKVQVDEEPEEPAAPVADAGTKTADAAADATPGEISDPTDDDDSSCPGCGLG